MAWSASMLHTHEGGTAQFGFSLPAVSTVLFQLVDRLANLIDALHFNRIEAQSAQVNKL